MSHTLQAIRYEDDPPRLEILDQLLLPHVTKYIPVCNTQDGYDVIHKMQVRGAPAIAIVGALSLAVELECVSQEIKPEELAELIINKLNFLVTSRPTAVNLSQSCELLKDLTTQLVQESQSTQDIIKAIQARCKKMLIDDYDDNKRIGEFGKQFMLSQISESETPFSVVTICNTGSLATSGYGTALGIIRALHEAKLLQQVYPLETRPYNQGARLTAYELVYDQIPATLITDSMAASLFRAHPEIKLVVVGADRVAANGDTANKIGTYQLAVLAKYHNVKFVVAAPVTSIDLSTKSGDDIVIEERPADELTKVSGVIRDAENNISTCKVEVAAPGIKVWNPAFDVTPKDLIDAIVTDKGVAVKNEDGDFQLDKLVNSR